MRLIIAIFCLFVSYAGYAQKKDSVVNQGAPGAAYKGYINCGCGNSKQPIYVIDGVEQDSMTNIKAQDIFKIDILKASADAVKYGPKSKNGVVLITTVLCAREQIEKKLVAFSKSVGRYITLNANAKITYVLNDFIADERAIYDLPKEKIRDVKLINYAGRDLIKITSHKFINADRESLQLFLKSKQ